ncbi:MAG: TlpA family protein disulfide reductase [Akkermansiaceae bacterium]|nr:TlpA family protein disulfide reductase [Akkermansiaceae bacterium]
MVATVERVARYFGADIDQHELAQLANTGDSGTNPDEMEKAFQRVTGKIHLRTLKHIEFDGRQLERDIRGYNRAAKSADKKTFDVDPDKFIISPQHFWSVADAPTFRDMKRGQNGFKHFERKIKEYVDQGIPLCWTLYLGMFPEKGLPQSFGGHMRMIFATISSRRPGGPPDLLHRFVGRGTREEGDAGRRGLQHDDGPLLDGSEPLTLSAKQKPSSATFFRDMKPSTALFSAALALTLPAAAQKAGDKVTPEALSKLEWIQGEAPAEWEAGKLYVIECWATWCGPCIAAIPHVDELYDKYQEKGLRVIGVNVWEDGKDKVAEFVKKKGDGMSYPVAYTGKGGAFETEWLKPAEVSGIPHAFVVMDGEVLFTTHPSRLNDETIEQLLSGPEGVKKVAADLREAGREREEIGKLSKAFAEAARSKDTEGMRAPWPGWKRSLRPRRCCRASSSSSRCPPRIGTGSPPCLRSQNPSRPTS